MNCWKAKRRSADFVDGRLREGEKARVAAHLAECRTCALHVDQLQSVRSKLSALPMPGMPVNLRMALRVAASRERQAVVEAQGGPWRRALSDWCFRLNELLKPITVPATGGVLSTVVLFSALAITIGAHSQEVNYDVPVMYSDALLDANLVPLEMRSSVLLTFSLDGRGRITDYAVREGQTGFVGSLTRMQGPNISIPAFSSVLGLTPPTNRDISIQFVSIGYRR